MPKAEDKRIPLILRTGKKIALSRLPAKKVFKRLQVEKNKPMAAQEYIFFLLIWFCPFFITKKNESDTAKQKIKAIKTKVLVWLTYSDFCCIFCTTPSPPEHSIARISGIRYDFVEPLLPFDFLPKPEIKITGITVTMPRAPHTVISSLQNIAPDRVGMRKPKE